jgi:hypothetical protein
MLCILQVDRAVFPIGLVVLAVFFQSCKVVFTQRVSLKQLTCTPS